MKTTTRTPAPIQAYTDDDGRPICGECGLQYYTGSGYICDHKTDIGTVGSTCPIWGEGSKEAKDNE